MIAGEKFRLHRIARREAGLFLRLPRERFERYRRRFSPYGSLASLYLWAIAGGALPELDDPAERKKGRSRPAASLKSTVTKD